ncbi:MAG: FAD:protein FMN transferase [Lachnospiraceae bacterium]|nr:FAD:protein FMN transferase [Lachnospiraceae bacterium]
MKIGWKKVAASLVLVGVVAAMVCFLQEENKSTTRSLFAMDTYMEITAYGRNSENAVEAAVDEIERLDALLSTGSAASEITMLNQNKTAVVSEDSAYLLRRSMELWKSTGGAFDITIYPVMKSWGFAGDTFRVPTDQELKRLLDFVDSSQIAYDEETKTVVLPEQVEIDFGGIAKGYTSARVSQIMEEYHIKSAKLNLGGNVQTVGTKADGSLWRIAIKSPDDTFPYLGVISVEDKAVITSGGYERYFEENGIIYHHIIDPKNGKPAQNGLVSVTIVCEDGTLADGLSTALYVMGKDDAITYWKAHKNEFDAVLFDDTGMLYVTEGLEGSFMSELEYEIVSEN